VNPLKKLAGQTAIYGLSSIVGRFINYLMVPLLTRVFTTTAYGDVVYWYAFVSFLSVLLTYGMETAFFRFSESHPNKNTVYTTALSSLFVTSGLFILFALIFSGSISSALDYAAHPEYVSWFAIIIGVDAFTSIPFARLRQQEKGLKFAALKLLNILINIFVLVFFLVLCPLWKKHFPGTLPSFVYSEKIGVGYVFIANMLASVATLFMLLPEITSVKLKINLNLYKQMLTYAVPLLFAGLAGMVNETLDRILLAKFITIPDWVGNAHDYIMSQTGIYGANYKLAILMTLFIQTFRYAAEPFFFAYAKQKDASRVYSDVMKYFIIFGLIIFLGVTLYLDFAKLFIGESFYEGLGIVPILLLANLFLGIVYNLSIWYKLTNKTRFGAYISVFGAVVTVVLNILLIPYFGYLGAAWATFVCYASMVAYSYYLGQKHYPVSYELKSIAMYFGIALSIFFVDKILGIDNLVLKTFVNTAMLLGFIGFAVKNENLEILLKKLIKK
jgi:O-antigen/teichoic acid export membrane protein